jgi:hypothetical protein
MKDRAEELSPGRIRFNHELVALEQDDEGVLATVPRQRFGHGVPGAQRVSRRR